MIKKKTPFYAILMIIFCTLLTSFGQFFIKKGTANILWNFSSIITNFPFLFGFFLYGLGAIVLIFALKHGELSVLYPFIALSFIWVYLLSFFLLSEKITIFKWLGIVFIIVGVSFIGVGGSRE